MSDAYLLLEIDPIAGLVFHAFVAGATYNTITRRLNGGPVLVEALHYPGANYGKAMHSMYDALIEGVHPELNQLEAVQALLRKYGERAQGHDHEPPE